VPVPVALRAWCETEVAHAAVLAPERHAAEAKG
jgi:hypothetical protein